MPRKLRSRRIGRGFPCHLSADFHESDGGEDDGYVFGAETQHCVGYIIMQLHESSGSPWPGINNDEELLDQLADQIDWDAPVFHSHDEYMKANGKDQNKGAGRNAVARLYQKEDDDAR